MSIHIPLLLEIYRNSLPQFEVLVAVIGDVDAENQVVEHRSSIFLVD